MLTWQCQAGKGGTQIHWSCMTWFSGLQHLTSRSVLGPRALHILFSVCRTTRSAFKRLDKFRPSHDEDVSCDRSVSIGAGLSGHPLFHLLLRALPMEDPFYH